MAPETTPDELWTIQDEILTHVHQLDPIVPRLRRLQAGIVVVDDEPMIECDEEPSLAFELRGVLELAAGQLAEATALLRQAAVETEDTLRQRFLKHDRPPAGRPDPTTAAEMAERAAGNGSPEGEGRR